MKRAFGAIVSILAALAVAAFGEDRAQSGDQPLGRGRGGAPFAWNDKDRDGVCDVTGRPVGEGRPIGWARGRGPAVDREKQRAGNRNKGGIGDDTGEGESRVARRGSDEPSQGEDSGRR